MTKAQERQYIQHKLQNSKVQVTRVDTGAESNINWKEIIRASGNSESKHPSQFLMR